MSRCVWLELQLNNAWHLNPKIPTIALTITDQCSAACVPLVSSQICSYNIFSLIKACQSASTPQPLVCGRYKMAPVSTVAFRTFTSIMSYKTSPKPRWNLAWCPDVSPAERYTASMASANPTPPRAPYATASPDGAGNTVTSLRWTRVWAASQSSSCSEVCRSDWHARCDPLILSFALHRCVHGRCIPMDMQSYRCECQEGFHGALCNQQEELFNPCRRLQCKHGHCQISDTGDAYCHCEVGYSGELCDKGKKTNTKRMWSILFLMRWESMGETKLFKTLN